MAQTESRYSQQTTGILYAIAAFTFWGLVPIYFKQVDSVSPLEVLAHRIIWSVVLLLVILSVSGKFKLIAPILRDRSKLGLLLLSSFLVSLNWLIFIYAVSHSMILESSLGYFINPLISILLGYFFFDERVSSSQTIAIGLAFVAVLIQLMVVGSLPLVSLGLAFSFAFYGVVRKKVHIASIPGLFIETLLVLPIALLYLGYLFYGGSNSFLIGDSYVSVMLPLAGVVTVLPLLWFNAGTIRVNLTTMGMLQYIGSSLSFLVAIFVYDEALDPIKLLTFVLVWIGLIIFNYDIYKRRR